MKLKLLSVLLILVIIGGCSDDTELLLAESEISFVYEDESKVLESDCIDPNKNYKLLLRVVSNKIGDFKPTKVDYTLNGSLYSITFTSEGSKTIPVNLIEGENIAQIVRSGSESRIHVVSQEDFVLVE